jgi:hypothetical protein
MVGHHLKSRVLFVGRSITGYQISSPALLWQEHLLTDPMEMSFTLVGSVAFNLDEREYSELGAG